MTRDLAFNGRDSFAGRKFVGQLRSESWQVRVGHLAWPADRVARADERVRDDILSIDELNEFQPHCVFFEEGALASGKLEFKIPVDWLTSYVRAGGVLIVEGLDRGYFESSQPTEALNAEKLFLQLVLADGLDSEPMAPPYIRDEVSNDGHPVNIICRPQAMIAADWLRPVYEGIDQVVVGSPVPLAYGQSEILGTTEPSAAVLKMNLYQHYLGTFMWAKVLAKGLGYIAVIAGSVVHDYWVDENPDNARWLQNVIGHLVDTAGREAFVRGVSPARTETSVPQVGQRESSLEVRLSTSELISQPENHRVEFKETARWDIKTEKIGDEVTHGVLKTIAAFINSHGGTLLIGVRNSDQQAVGLDRDIATFKKDPSLDGLQLWLNEQIKNAMGTVAASLATIKFEQVSGNWICRVDVAPAKDLVPLSANKGKDKNGMVTKDDRVIYVRLGAQSNVLLAADVLTWLEQHRSS